MYVNGSDKYLCLSISKLRNANDTMLHHGLKYSNNSMQYLLKTDEYHTIEFHIHSWIHCIILFFKISLTWKLELKSTTREASLLKLELKASVLTEEVKH